MLEQELVEKVLVFRRNQLEPIQNLLREIANYLEEKPDLEQLVETITIDYYVSEPTEETMPDCVQMREAKVYLNVPVSTFGKVTVQELVISSNK